MGVLTKWLKRILTVAGICFGVSALLSAAALATVGLFTGSALNKDFNGAETEEYKQLITYMDDYQTELTGKMQEIKAAIAAEHMVYVPGEKPSDPGTFECSVTIDVQYYTISPAYYYAYLTAAHDEIKSLEKYRFQKEEVYDFLDSISEIKTEEDGDHFVIYNKLLTPEEIENLYFPGEDSKRGFYETSLENYKEFFKENGSQEFPDIDTEYPANGMGIPLYLQYDSRWGNLPYGQSDIKTSGCALTCLAMAVSYKKGQAVTPADILAVTGGSYYIPGVGSKWSIFPDVAAHYKIQCSNLGRDINAAMQSVSEGKPVIASMSPGTFTTSGHFIVLRGITENGNLLVNDPADTERKNHKGREFSPALIYRESKGFWSFE